MVPCSYGLECSDLLIWLYVDELDSSKTFSTGTYDIMWDKTLYVPLAGDNLKSWEMINDTL